MRKLLFGALLFAFGCDSGDTDSVVVIETKFGTMKAILYEETPLHKENFLKLTNEGFYDSLLFHRVIEGFMVQGGDPNSKNPEEGKALGTGGPGYTIPAEFVPKFFHKKGALSAARLGDQMNPKKASSGSQFYIVQGQTMLEEQLTVDLTKLANNIGKYLDDTGDTVLRNQLVRLYQNNQRAYLQKLMSLKSEMEQALNTSFEIDYPKERLEAYTSVGGAKHLDDQYTVFGEVVEGLEVIDQIAAQQTNRRDQPLEDIHMLVRVEKMSKSEISEKYGYQYPAIN